jgi:hypothetical protein
MTDRFSLRAYILDQLGARFTNTNKCQAVEPQNVVATPGVERWSQTRTALAAVLSENPDVVSFWAGEGARRRQEGPDYAAKPDELDERLSAALTRDG